jgi:hypothetical protein
MVIGSLEYYDEKLNSLLLAMKTAVTAKEERNV